MQRTINITKHETVDTKVGTKHIVYDEKKKYEFFENKKDGKPTKAFTQYKEFGLGVGSSCPAEVAEDPEKFTNKEGEEVKFTRRTILYWVGDEHGVPLVQELEKNTTGTFKGDVDITYVKSLEARVKHLEDTIFGTEKAVSVEDEPIPEDLPF